MTNISEALQIAVEHHRSGRIGEARSIYEQILAEFPEQPDALNLMGIVFQHEGDLDEAGKLFDRAIAAQPDMSGFHINRGNLLRLKGDLANSERAYRRALELRPDSADAHNNLGTVLQLQGNLDQAESCYRQATTLRPDYAEALYNIGVLLQEKEQLDEAATAYEQAIRANPGYAAASNNLGTVRQQQGELDAAERAYQQALKLQSDYPDAWFNLGNLQQERGDLPSAISAYQRAIALRPDFADAYRNLGSTYCRMGRLDEAESHERRAVELEPGQPHAWNNLGITLKDKGDTSGAEAAFRKSLEIDPGYAHARGNLASLLEVVNRLDDASAETEQGLKHDPDDALLNLIAAKLQRRDGKVEQALIRLNAVDIDALPGERAGQLHHELGMLYDRMEEPAQAVAALEKANAVLARETRLMGIDKRRYLNKLESLDRCFTPEWAAEWIGDVTPDADCRPPVFLVGFPRSGTTLLEVALDAHPALRTLEEQPTISQVAHRAGQIAPMPEALATFTAEQLTQLRDYYFSLVDEYAPDRGDVTIIDKMPLSIADVPLLWRLFPDAKFILALRHPADVVLSCFMQSFQPNVAMANLNTLEDAADLYDRVMGLWRRYAGLLPLHYHTVRYEDVVADFEKQIRALVKFLDLPWDDAVLEYRKSAAGRTRINTPSYHQVTEPIYTRAKFRWERYREQLKPIMRTLEPWIKTWGY